MRVFSKGVITVTTARLAEFSINRNEVRVLHISGRVISDLRQCLGLSFVTTEVHGAELCSGFVANKMFNICIKLWEFIKEKYLSKRVY